MFNDTIKNVFTKAFCPILKFEINKTEEDKSSPRHKSAFSFEAARPFVKMFQRKFERAPSMVKLQ